MSQADRVRSTPPFRSSLSALHTIAEALACLLFLSGLGSLLLSLHA